MYKSIKDNGGGSSKGKNYVISYKDVGEENEQQVIAELGDPAQVAATIKADLGGASKEHGEFTEKGYTDSRFENKDVPVGREYKESGQKSEGYGYRNTEQSRREYDYHGYGYERSGEQTPPRTNGALKIFLIIMLVLVAIPVGIPVAAAILITIAAVGFTILVLFFTLVIASVAIAFAGVCVFIAGLVSLAPEIAVGLALIGTGLILTVVGVVLTVASVRVCMIVLPGICRGFVWIVSRPFQRRAVV